MKHKLTLSIACNTENWKWFTCASFRIDIRSMRWKVLYVQYHIWTLSHTRVYKVTACVLNWIIAKVLWHSANISNIFQEVFVSRLNARWSHTHFYHLQTYSICVLSLVIHIWIKYISSLRPSQRMAFYAQITHSISVVVLVISLKSHWKSNLFFAYAKWWLIFESFTLP